MATLNLGRIKPVFRGAYNGATAYVVDDIVTHGDETFICILASTGNATSNATYWTKLAAKGTDGTDVGTTLTTQGDMLYRDGSGLQRLAKGTSGNVLKQGTNHPEWGTVSSDFVRLASLTQTSEVQSFSVDGYFTSDYDVYKIYLINATADGNKFQVQVNQGGSAATSSDYQYLAAYNDLTTGNTPSSSTSHSINDSQFRIGWQDDTASRRLSSEITIFDPLNTNRYKPVHYSGMSFMGSYWYLVQGVAQYENNTNAISGLTFKGHNSSYNVSADHIYVYGLKNS